MRVLASVGLGSVYVVGRLFTAAPKPRLGHSLVVGGAAPIIVSRGARTSG